MEFHEVKVKQIKLLTFKIYRLDPDPTIRTTFWNVLIGHTFRWLVTIIAHPALTQRFLSAPNVVESRRLILLFVVGMMVIKSILCFSGLIIYSKYSDCDPLSVGDIEAVDQIVPYYVLDVSNAIPGVGTVFTAGLISISLSVLSTLLNTCCVFYAEILSHVLSPSSKKKWGKIVMRIIPVLFGIIGMGLVFVVEKLGSLFEMSYVAIGCFVGTLLGVFIMGTIFSFANIKGALSGGIVSLVCMLFFVVKTQIYIWEGIIRYEPKPLSVNGCNKTDLNMTSSMLHSVDSLVEPLWLFKISFHYYICMGCIICVIIGLIVSWITRKEENLDPDLLSPVVRKFIYKNASINKYESVSAVDDFSRL